MPNDPSNPVSGAAGSSDGGTSATRSAAFVLLGVVALVGVLLAPGEQYPGDPWAWIIEASGLANRGTITVPETVAKGFGDPGLWTFYNEHDQRYVSKYGFGSTLLLVAPYKIQNWLGGGPVVFGRRLVATTAMHWLLGLALAYLLYRTAGLFTARPRLAFSWVLIVLFSTFVWFYMRAQSSELYQLVAYSAYLYCMFRALREKRSLPWLAVASTALGFLCLVKSVYAVLIPVNVVAVLLWTWRDSWTPDREARNRSGVLLPAISIAVPALAFIALLLVINAWKFGSPLEFGYSQWRLEQNPFSGNPFTALWGYLVNPRHSVWFHFWPLPVALLAYRSFARQFPRELALTVVNFVVMLGLYCRYWAWHGEACYGPRYLLFGLPALAIPLLFVLERLREPGRWMWRCVLDGVMVLAISCQVLVALFPFFYYYSIRDTLVTELDDSSSLRYLDSVPFPAIYAEFAAWRWTGRMPSALEGASRRVDPARFERARTVLWNELRPNVWWLSRRAGGGRTGRDGP